MLEPTPLYGGNADFLDALYEQYLRDPASVDERWRELFRRSGPRRRTSGRTGPSRRPSSCARPGRAPAPPRRPTPGRRTCGRRPCRASSRSGPTAAICVATSIRSASRPGRGRNVLELGLLRADAGRPRAGVLHRQPHRGGAEAHEAARHPGAARVHLRRQRSAPSSRTCRTPRSGCGCRTSSRRGAWRHRFSAEERRNILWQLTAAEGLERYLHTKYVGQKRFSLEGGDAFIPLLDDLIQQSGAAGIEEVRHRHGAPRPAQRAGEPARQVAGGAVLRVRGQYTTSRHLKGSGDVKYHKGFSADLRTPAATCIPCSPSIPRTSRSSNPVVEGSVRARQERRGDERRRASAAACWSTAMPPSPARAW